VSRLADEHLGSLLHHHSFEIAAEVSSQQAIDLLARKLLAVVRAWIEDELCVTVTRKQIARFVRRDDVITWNDGMGACGGGEERQKDFLTATHAAQLEFRTRWQDHFSVRSGNRGTAGCSQRKEDLPVHEIA